MAFIPTRPFAKELREQLTTYFRSTKLNPKRRTQSELAKGKELAAEVQDQQHLIADDELYRYVLKFLTAQPLQGKGTPTPAIDKQNRARQIDDLGGYFYRTFKGQLKNREPVRLSQLPDLEIPDELANGSVSERSWHITHATLIKLGCGPVPSVRTLQNRLRQKPEKSPPDISS